MGGEQQGQQQFSSLDDHRNNTAYQLDNTTPVGDLTDAQIAELLSLDFLNHPYSEQHDQQREEVPVGVGDTGA